MQILIHIGSAYIMDLMKRFESWAEYLKYKFEMEK